MCYAALKPVGIENQLVPCVQLFILRPSFPFASYMLLARKHHSENTRCGASCPGKKHLRLFEAVFSMADGS